MMYRIIVTNTQNEIIYDEVIECTRYSHAERAAIAACKEFGGKQWHIKVAR